MIVALLALIPVAASAQSLADVAKQEEARRKGVKSGRRLTNADLLPDTRTPAPPAAPIAAATVSGNTSPNEPPVVAAPAANSPAEPRSEAFWRGRADEHRSKIEKARADVASLTGTSNADAGVQARAESLLKRAQDRLAWYEAAQTQFEAQAAAAKIPVAWIK